MIGKIKKIMELEEKLIFGKLLHNRLTNSTKYIILLNVTQPFGRLISPRDYVKKIQSCSGLFFSSARLFRKIDYSRTGLKFILDDL